MTENLSRRDFLARAAAAVAAAAATGLVTYGLHDRRGPARPGEARSVQLPDFRIKGSDPARRGQTPSLAIVTGSDRAKTVEKGLEAIGGIGRFIGRGDRVLVKVNAAFASPPSLCATTHPDLVDAVVRLCRAAGAASVVVTDNPINDPASCFELSGIRAATERAGGRIVLPAAEGFRNITLAGGTLIRDWPFLHAPFRGITKLIGLAPLKDHNRAGASMTLKNWYGLLGGRRSVFHQDIHGIVKELALLVRPTLVVLDGTTAMMTNGPTGGSLSDLKPTNTMIVSTDPVAADAFGATLLGKSAADLPYLRMAAAAGAGTATFEMLNPVRVSA